MWVLRTVTDGVPEKTFRILPGTVRTMGRATGADFIVDVALVSRVHCRFTATPDGGLEVHEAVIGDATVQDAWEAAEAATEGAPPGPTPVVSVPPDVAGIRVVVQSGERVDLVWTVPAEAADARESWVVGCHIPAHWEAGMVVPIRWVAGGLVAPESIRRPKGTVAVLPPSSGSAGRPIEA